MVAESSAASFESIACDYDKIFTGTAVGRLLRERVRRLLMRRAALSDQVKVLEINCGTGEDAIWLAEKGCRVLATDISPEMTKVAQKKAAEAECGERLQIRTSSFAGIGQIPEGNFDLIFSNFGGLNCIPPEQLEPISKILFNKLRPGGRVIVVVMSRFCWWETMYFLFKGKIREAFRRRSRNPVIARLNTNATLPVWYYSPVEFCTYFPDFEMQKADPAGFWLPPSYLNPFFEKHPRFLSLLNFLEKNCNPACFAPAADHFFVRLEKPIRNE